MLKDYFIKFNALWIIEEHEENKKFLTDSTRSKMVKHVVNFMVKKFGLYPSKFQKTSTAKATIELFPSILYKNSCIGGIVSKIQILISFDL